MHEQSLYLGCKKLYYDHRHPFSETLIFAENFVFHKKLLPLIMRFQFDREINVDANQSPFIEKTPLIVLSNGTPLFISDQRCPRGSYEFQN